MELAQAAPGRTAGRPTADRAPNRCRMRTCMVLAIAACNCKSCMPERAQARHQKASVATATVSLATDRSGHRSRVRLQNRHSPGPGNVRGGVSAHTTCIESAMRASMAGSGRSVTPSPAYCTCPRSSRSPSRIPPRDAHHPEIESALAPRRPIAASPLLKSITVENVSCCSIWSTFPAEQADRAGDLDVELGVERGVRRRLRADERAGHLRVERRMRGEARAVFGCLMFGTL